MSVNYMEWDCPACGKKNREACSTWVYGSPIRTCSHCNAEHLDQRWREVAIDGFDPRSTNSGFYLKGTIAFGVLALAALLMLFVTIQTKGYYHTSNVLIVFAGVLGCILCLIMFLRIRFGWEAKSQQKYLEESKLRLQDPEYVKKLQSYGYVIPDHSSEADSD